MVFLFSGSSYLQSINDEGSHKDFEYNNPANFEKKITKLIAFILTHK